MNEKLKRAILAAFVVFSTAFAFLYMAYITLFVLQGIPQILLGLTFVILIGAMAIFNILGIAYYWDSYFVKPEKPGALPRKLPLVAVAITSFNESPKMISATIKSLKGIKYPSNQIKLYLVDDSTGKVDVAELARICKAEGVEFVHRSHRGDYKAGALNNLLRKTKAEYLAVFDADETLVDENFFLENIGHFYKDAKLICVQTVKKARTAGLFADAIDETYGFFTRFIQPVRSRDKMAMFQGSCGILRVSHVRAVGGFPASVTEDTALSFVADYNGYTSIFVPKTYALGRPIETYSGFVTQQHRYAYGNASLVPDFFRNYSKYSPKKKAHYLAQVFGFPYLSLVYLTFSLLTASFAVMGISAVILSGQAFWTFAARIAFMDLVPLGMTLLNIILIAIFFFGSFSKGIVAYFLNFAVTLVRAQASINALFSRKKFFQVVQKQTIAHKKSIAGAFKFTSQETSFSIALLIFAFTSFLHADIIGGLWLVYYFTLFISAFVFAYYKG